MALDRKSIIQNLYSITAGSQPTPTDLEYGEIAVNIVDGKLFFRSDTDSLTTVNSGDFVTSVNGKTGDVDVVTGYTAQADTPSSANTGDFWLETDTGDLFFYDGSAFVQISGADGADGLTGATGPTGPVGDYVESFNGATGAIEKLHGCFYNSSSTEFTTTLTTIGLDTVMYNSDPSGLTLSSNRLQINKSGTFKITFDISCGLSGGLPGTALQSKFDVYKKSGILSPTIINGTSAYHEMPRANPANQLQFTDTSSITMITNGHVTGNSYLIQGNLDVGTIGSSIFHVPSESYRVTVEEL